MAIVGILVTGALGLAGIGAQMYGTKRQADVSLAQIAAERARQDAQHAEEHRRNRQTTYHLLLTAAAQLRAMRGDVASGTEEAERVRWEFLHLLHGVELFATEDVRQAAVRVSAALETAANRVGRPIEIIEARLPRLAGHRAAPALNPQASLSRSRSRAARTG